MRKRRRNTGRPGLVGAVPGDGRGWGHRGRHPQADRSPVPETEPGPAAGSTWHRRPSERPGTDTAGPKWALVPLNGGKRPPPKWKGEPGSAQPGPSAVRTPGDHGPGGGQRAGLWGSARPGQRRPGRTESQGRERPRGRNPSPAWGRRPVTGRGGRGHRAPARHRQRRAQPTSERRPVLSSGPRSHPAPDSQPRLRPRLGSRSRC